MLHLQYKYLILIVSIPRALFQNVCVTTFDCSPNKSCRNGKCVDPCVGSCGSNTECRVFNHTVECCCLANFEGEPFTGCIRLPKYPSNKKRQKEDKDVDSAHSCRSFPCGINAHRAVDHVAAYCTCDDGYNGDPYSYSGCQPIQAEQEKSQVDSCNPSPCGSYSRCKNLEGTAQCHCIDGAVGWPPFCKPECISDTNCPRDKECVQQKCVNPCPGPCASSAVCTTIRHKPNCVCPINKPFGDPLVECSTQPSKVSTTQLQHSSCNPNPCGRYSKCRLGVSRVFCQCSSGYIGNPPNCHPECEINEDCPEDKSCLRGKCDDLCPRACGFNYICYISNHSAQCRCPQGFTDDPFDGCKLNTFDQTKLNINQNLNPCSPSPCGPNSQCTEISGKASCTCLLGYFDDLFEGCLLGG